jgi:hypothetical protein
MREMALQLSRYSAVALWAMCKTEVTTPQAPACDSVDECNAGSHPSPDNLSTLHPMQVPPPLPPPPLHTHQQIYARAPTCDSVDE